MEQFERGESTVIQVCEGSWGIGLRGDNRLHFYALTPKKQRQWYNNLCRLLVAPKIAREYGNSHNIKRCRTRSENSIINRMYEQLREAEKVSFNDGKHMERLLIAMMSVFGHKLSVFEGKIDSSFHFFLVKQANPAAGNSIILRVVYSRFRQGFLFEKSENRNWVEHDFIPVLFQDLVLFADFKKPEKLTPADRQIFYRVDAIVRRIVANADFMPGRSDVVAVTKEFILEKPHEYTPSPDNAKIITIKALNATIANTETRVMVISEAIKDCVSLEEAKALDTAFSTMSYKDTTRYKDTNDTTHKRLGNSVSSNAVAYASLACGMPMNPYYGRLPDSATLIGLSLECSIAVANRANWPATNLKDKALGFTEFAFYGIRQRTISGKIGGFVSFTENDELVAYNKVSDTHAQSVAIREYIMKGSIGSVQCDTLILCGRDSFGKVKCFDAWDYSDMAENPENFYSLLDGPFYLETPSDKNGGVIAGVVEVNGTYHYMLSVAVQLRISESKIKAFLNERQRKQAKTVPKTRSIGASPALSSSVIKSTRSSTSLSRCKGKQRRVSKANSHKKVESLI